MSDTLSAFSLRDLAPFKNGGLPTNASPDHLLMFVGRDDVHEALKYTLSRCTRSLYMNMFGYDDDELNGVIWKLVENPAVTVQITLDKSQAGGVHEKRLLDADRANNLADFNTHFVIGQSATHQISHTKGGVIDGVVGWHGSTNWSDSGEGTFVVKGQPGGVGYKAQNNTNSFFVDQYSLSEFTDQLHTEHLAAQARSRPAK